MKKKILACLIVTITFFVSYLPARGAEPFYNITGIYFRNTEVGIGERLYVDYMGKKSESIEITGFFLNDAGNSYVSLPLKDITTNDPYFEISRFMQTGVRYTMTALRVVDEVDNITYQLTTSNNSNTSYMNPMGKNIVNIKNPINITGFNLLSDKNVDLNGSIKLELKTDQDVGFTTIAIQNKDIASIKALVSIKTNAETTIELSKLGTQYLTIGEYQITDVFLNPDDSSKFVHYSINPQDDTTKKLEYNVEFNIINNQGPTQPETNDENNLLRSIKVLKTSANLNEKVGVEIDTSEPITFASLVFSNDKESMTVSLKDLDTSSPFFVIPFTTSEGIYELDYVILRDENGKKYQYREGVDYYDIKHFDFNSTIEVKNEINEGNLLNLDNNKITSKTIEKIAELDENIAIEIDGNNNPVIAKELFEAIKGSNKTINILYGEFEWIFNGLDINNPKQIDVSAIGADINNKNDLSDKVQNGIIIEFPENGELPGKCLIRVHTTDYIFKILNRDNINVYYYNDETGEFEPVELDLAYNPKGYYEFYISHNSNYILTKDRLDITDEKNDKTVLYISIAAASIIIAIMIATGIIVIIKKKKETAKADTNVSIDNPIQQEKTE